MKRLVASLTLVAGLALGAVSTAAADTYDVAPGDTVTEIAARFGVDVETLVAANSLANPHHILPGQQLTVPVAGLPYTVRPGDTLIGIGARFQIDPAGIVVHNELEDPDLIVTGSQLLLPGARPLPPRPPGPPQAASRPATPSPAPDLAPVREAQEEDTPETHETERGSAGPTARGDAVVELPLGLQAQPGGRTLVVRVTAYSYQTPGAGARGSVTRSGTPVRWGVLAVDPQVIPLGSRVLIEGFDEVFVAEDTGSAVRGAHVEIFHTDRASALRFGVQTRRVTILE